MQTKLIFNLLRLTLIASVAAVTFAVAGSVTAQTINCPGAPKSRLVIGRDANVSPGGTPNNLRDTPSKSGKILSKQDPGTILTVMAGPICADNLAWWEVALLYDNTTSGWMAEGSGTTYYMDPTTTAITLATIPDGASSVNISFGNASLIYNAVYGTTVEADRVFGVQRIPNQEVPDFAVYPDYIEFRFDLSTSTNGLRYPELDVYPVGTYAQMVPQVTGLSSKLKKILATQPPNFTYSANDSNRGIPTLPVPNAAQVIAADIKYLPFSGGTGVRFITAYAQDVSPVTNERIAYYYQGLTNDGKYWVSARFPITSRLLAKTYADDKDFPDPSNVTDATVFDKYYNAILTKLNGAQPTDFTPSMDTIDALMQSISVK